MAHSSLFQQIRKAHQLAKKSIQLGLPVDDIWHQYTTRRNLIRAGLLTGGLLTASTLYGCSNTEQTVKINDKDVVLIVGAGIAGLTAGYRLWQKNIPIKIIEASDRVGGRMLSQSNALGTDKTTELGGEFINTGHKNIQALVKEVGLELVDLLQLDQGLTEEVWFFNNQRIEFQQVAEAFVPLARQIEKDKEAIGDFNYQNPNQFAKEIDRLSLRDYLRKYTRNPLLEELLAVAYTIEYGREVEEQSCFNLIYLIGTDEKLVVFGESDERYSIKGGNQQLPQKLAQKLANSIESNSYFESIAPRSDGRYQVSIRQGGTSKEEVYQRIILAIPFSILRTIDLKVSLPEIKQTAIKEMGYGYNAKLITSYQQKLWRTRYKSNGSVFSDQGWQNTWETGKYTPSLTGLITNYLGGNACLNLSENVNSEADKFVSSFNKVFPAVEQLHQKSLLINWQKLPLFQASYSCYLVGQMTKFLGVNGEPFQNIFFAGEHCSIEYQGYMEGACATGELVAKQIMQS